MKAYEKIEERISRGKLAEEVHSESINLKKVAEKLTEIKETIINGDNAEY